MGMDLVDSDAGNSIGIRSFFAEAGERIGTDIVSLLSSSDESLKRTDVSQVAITACSLAAALALKARGILPSACAGFSLGEYPALAVSGVISFSDAIYLTKERGRIMQAACDAIASSGSAIPGMAAVLGLSPEKIDEVIASLGIPNLFGANYNSPFKPLYPEPLRRLTPPRLP
jgi:[acyl-carrier-protein] S-malonyltransferase